MAIHDEANLILKLYDLRREETMRKARDWYFREFNPQSFADFQNAMFSEHSGHLRMVTSYWDMAAALVNHGAIGMHLFSETNGEYIGVYAKVEPFLNEIRSAMAPQYFANLEKLVNSVPGDKERVLAFRERMKMIQAEMATRQARA
jgi:hypothetical protein